MDFHLDTLLNLPNIVAESYSSTLDAIVVKLQLVNAGINCPNCNEYICHVHQTRPILVRDLSVFGQVVYLKVPRRQLGETHAEETSARFHPQFYCSSCKTSPTELLSWLSKKQRQTNRYQEYIYEKVKELTVKQVSENEKMCVAGHPRRSEDAVQDIFHKVAQFKKKRMLSCAFVSRRFSATLQDWGLPTRLSLDEFARRKGKGQFATILTDLDKSSLLEVIDSHKSEDIITVLKQQPLAMREGVKEVCVLLIEQLVGLQRESTQESN
jgi:transposase